MNYTLVDELGLKVIDSDTTFLDFLLTESLSAQNKCHFVLTKIKIEKVKVPLFF